jgi:hypothetical protein
MPYRDVYVKMRAYVPPRRPSRPEFPGEGGPPDWGIPEFPEGPWEPGSPEFPWVPDEPGIGGGPIFPERPEWPGRPERPDQGLPRPPAERGPYPIIEAVDLGEHPELPDLNHSRFITVTTAKARAIGAGWPAWVVMGDTEEDAEPRHPEQGHPGEWVAVFYAAAARWAWVLSPPTDELPEVDPEPTLRR